MNNNFKRKRKRKRENNNYYNLPILSIISIIIFFVLLRMFISWHRTSDFFEYYNISETGTVIVEDTVSGYSFESDDTDTYFCFDFVKEYIDPYIFWDETDKKLTVTTEDKVIRMESDELDYYVNNEPLSLDIPFYIENNEPFIPSSILKKIYNIKINKNENPNIITIDFKDKDFFTAETLKKTKIYFDMEKPYIKIKDTLKKGSKIYVYPENSNEDFYKIRTDSGYTGYLPKKTVGDINSHKSSENENDSEKSENNFIDGKINMTFEQVTTYSANNNFQQTVPEGVNVLSPTWFSFEDDEGNIKNIADKYYVDSAHENGAQVWALITDNFDAKISHSILSATNIREHIIKQLLAFISLYDLDGINIDFEAVPEDDGDYYIQFLRELAPLLKQQGTVLSVDMFVPKKWTEHYNREEAARVVDYIIVMGYDEHYGSGGVSGTVASIGWSEESISATLERSVPKEKLILGIPFYTRIWKEAEGENGTEVTSKAYSMDEAKKFMDDRGVNFEWLEDMGQYYAEYEENNEIYKLWLEDERSVRLRLDLIKQYNIAGCASWKRGFENKDIWKVIKDELN